MGIEQGRHRVQVVAEQARVMSSVMAADECPSIRCTALTLASAAMANEAAWA
jgi:hypothetical protein